MLKFLLASDMDGTLIPLDRRPGRRTALARFRAAMQAHEEISLAYVTGRHLHLALRGIREYGLPPPRRMVCDVGTSVFVRRGRTWTVDQAYRRIMKILMGGAGGADVADVLDDVEHIAPQEDMNQAEFKRSYYVEPGVNNVALCRRIKSRLARRGIRANLVYSFDAKKNTGLLDVLPAGVAKDTALTYLQKKLHLPPENIVYAGDSGNDLLAFLSGYQAIVVRNTPETVTRVLRQAMKKKKLEERIYFASRKYTAGVLEGCRHFGLL